MHIAESNSRVFLASSDNLLLYEPSGAHKTAKIPPPDLPPNLTKGQLQVLNKEDRTIIAIAAFSTANHVAVATENKQIVIFDENLEVVKNFIVNRAASKLLFTSSGDILVADRTGDVYLYKLCEKSESVLLLGHLSMILDVVLTRGEKFIITCDRDEKIRISHYLNTYNIQSFCLGHEEFVTCIKLFQDVLLSASGDGTVRVWDFLKGQQLCKIDVNQFVGNKNLLDEFSQKMDFERVDVTALPVTDMQICNFENFLYTVVSLHNYDELQMFQIDLETYKWKVMKSVKVDSPHKFYLGDRKLYIFDNSKVRVYQLIDGDWCVCEDQKLGDFYKNNNDFLSVSDDSITVLYKRKFDNVQEYLERKKLRLETGK